MTDLTPIFEALITLAAAAVTLILVPWIRQKLGDAKTDELIRWVGIFVRAAEQIYRESGMGKEKKAYVLDKLRELGYSLSTEALDEMIEASVLEMNREVLV